jgi:hypothetical protein
MALLSSYCASGTTTRRVHEAAPNNSFKPNLLRYTKAVAERACHGFGSASRIGLIQVLGLIPEII